MTNDQWQRVQRLFERALERSPEERPAFVADACGHDEELRAEVESLLDHDELASSDFMRTPGSGWGRSGEAGG